MRSGERAASVLPLVVASVVMCACSDGTRAPTVQERKGGLISFPVEVERVQSRSVDYGISAVGSVEAFDAIHVTARVAGVVERVVFREGDQVKRDQVLVEIEPERYRLAVDQARANVEKSEAQLSEAEAALARRETASENQPGLIRGEEIDTFRAKARTARAERFASRTALAQAELNLRDAVLRAPIAGTIETRTVHEGQYVQPGTLLASMIRRDPLILRFKIPARDAAYLRSGMEVAFTTRRDPTMHTAKITLVAGTAEEGSRMVAVTAEIHDTNRGARVAPGRAGSGTSSGAQEAARLTPGTFAEVSVTLGARNGPVIPQRAVRPSERGFLAYVVDGSVARERVLVLGMRTTEGDVEVKSGLEAGELVVTRGSEALRDGSAVRIIEAKPPGNEEDKSTAESLGSREQ